MVTKEIYIFMSTKIKLNDSFPASQSLIQGFCTQFGLDQNRNAAGIFLYQNPYNINKVK